MLGICLFDSDMLIQEKALHYLGRKKKKRVRELLNV